MKEQRVPDIMDLEYLTSGSNWLRDNGKVSRFLFLTNAHLPQKMQDIHPQMVVYADENDNVMSVPVMDFLARRKFHNIDPALEQRLDNLLAYDGADSSEDDTFSLLSDGEDGIEIEDDESIDDTVVADVDQTEEQRAEITANAMANNMFPVFYEAQNPEKPALIDLAFLATVTESYLQQPIHGTDRLCHTLFVREVENIVDSEKLSRCFDPSNAEDNAILSFTVDLGATNVAITGDTFVGAFPYVFQNQRMIQIMVTTGNVVHDITQPVADAVAESDVDFQIVAENIDGLPIVATSDTAALIPIETVEQALAESSTPPAAEPSGFTVVTE